MTNALIISILEFVACSHLLLFGSYMLLRKNARPGVKWVGAFILFLGLHFAMLASLQVSDNLLLAALTDYFTSIALFVYGPLLYLANLAMADIRVTVEKHGWHFLIIIIPLLEELALFPAIANWPMTELSDYRVLIYLHNLTYIGCSVWVFFQSRKANNGGWFMLSLNAGYALMILSFVLLLIDAEFNGGAAYIFYKVFFLVVLTSMVDGMLILTLHKPESLKKQPNKIITGSNRSYLEKVLAQVRDAVENQGRFQQQDLTLQSLSAIIGFPAHDISLAVNRLLGSTFREYINQLRVERSWILLQDHPDMRINEVMYQAGYNSRSLFLKNFKEKYGLTPSQARKKMSCVQLSGV